MTMVADPMTLPHNAPAYETDFVAWLEDQAGRARRGEVDSLDLDNIAEELEGLARTDRHEIGSRLTVLLMHLLKYEFQPKRRARSWLATIIEQRQQIARLLSYSPSLRSFPASILTECYVDACKRAAVETGMPESTFPERCLFAIGEALDPEWLP
jgi:Domain of unknown function DUF29